jgi:cytoskeletal protein RodZ
VWCASRAPGRSQAGPRHPLGGWFDVPIEPGAQMSYLPLIVIEIVLVFGGVLAFAWWQFRDLARERKKREDSKQDSSSS